MGRKTHGPYLVAAIEMNDIQKVSDILSTKFRDKSKVKTFLISDVRRLASDYSEVPLLLAATLEDPTILKYMVQKHDTNINYIQEYGFQKPKKRKTALLVAVKRGLYLTVDTIVSLNADVNVQDHKGRTPLHHAIKRADYRMVKLLVSRGAQVMLNDISGNSPLHVATIYGHTELIKLLLKYGGDLYKKGQYGAIPIHIAAKEGHSSIVKMFFETYEVNPDIKVPCYDELEKTPMHVAASQGHAETLYTLITLCGVDINLRDSEGNTALHHAVLNDYDPLGMKSKDDFADTVKVLLNAGAAVNLQNGRGETALHLAARSEFQKVIEVLILAGCDPLVEDNDKNRALDLVADDDAVSKQTIKNAIANRDRLMFDSAEVRAQGFQTNFNRGTVTTASSRSYSLLNVNGLNTLNSSRVLTPNFGSQNYIPPNLANVYYGSHSSSNSSNKRSKESVLSGSKLLSAGKKKDQTTYHTTRRTKSVEDLDVKRKTKKPKKNEASEKYRKNSYQESEATSMWSVTPPDSVQDLTNENGYLKHKKIRGNKKLLKNPETIIESQEYDNNSYGKDSKLFKSKFEKVETASSNSEDYFLDDESIDNLLDKKSKFSKKYKEKDRVTKWVESSRSNKHQNDYESDSETSESSFGTEYSKEVGDYDTFQTVNDLRFSRRKNASVEQVIELDATGDFDETTIKVIPLSGKQKSRAYSENKIIKSPDKQEPKPSIKKPNLEGTSSKTTQPPFIELEKPVPRKRTNIEKKNYGQDLSISKSNNLKIDSNDGVKSNELNDTTAKKVDKTNVHKKTNNLIFTKASDQSLDNIEHSNLARISAGDFAIPAKPTYSSTISPALSNSYMDNSSRSLQQIQNKLSTSGNNNDNFTNKSIDGLNISNAKSIQSHYSRIQELDESNDETSFEKDENAFSAQRIVTFSNNDNLPFILIGGNDTGIFVDAVDRNSSAFKNGLLSGDKILKVNKCHVIGKTKEEVDNILRQNIEPTTLIVLKDIKTYKILVKLNGSGDSIYVKSYFKYEAKKKGDLNVNPGNIFHVVDTLPQGNPGFWKAKLIGSKQLESDEGLIPNQQRAEQQATKEKLLNVDSYSNERVGTFFRSFRRSKSSDRNSKDNTSISVDENKDAAATIPVVYERVIVQASKFRRPVIILGLFCDVVRNKLVNENPILFEKPDEPEETFKNNKSSVNLETVQKSFKNGKHSLIILSPPSVEYILKNTDLNPIVLYLSPVSKAVVKSVKTKLAPNYMKDAGYMFDEAIKFEKNYSELFTSIIGYTTDEWWYHNLKEAINKAQSQPVWQNITQKEIDKMNNEKALEYFPEEVELTRRKKDQKQKQSKRISRTTDDLPLTINKFDKNENSKNKISSTTNITDLKPEIKQKPKIQAKKFLNPSIQTHETPL